MTVKERMLALLSEGTPMLSIEMAKILNITKASSSMTAKELNEAGFIHVCEWRHNPKNGGNKVYAIGTGVDVVKPSLRSPNRNEPFKPHPDVAAAWMMK